MTSVNSNSIYKDGEIAMLLTLDKNVNDDILENKDIISLSNINIFLIGRS